MRARHADARPSPWRGARARPGSAVVVGAGKMGLPLAAQFASHGWTSSPSTSTRPSSRLDQRGPLAGRRGAGPRRAGRDGRTAAGRLRATLERRPRRPRGRRRRADRAGRSSTTAARPDHRQWMRRSPPSHRAPRRALVIYETTLPVGDTRERYGPTLEAATGLRAETTATPASCSPSRRSACTAAPRCAIWPPIRSWSAASGPPRRDRAAAFYDSVLDAEIVAMSSAEAAEFAKLADTTYRDVNIALANEFAALRRPGRRRPQRGHRGGQQPALQPHPPARASASAATASRSIRTSCSTGRRSCRSWPSPAKSTTARSTWRSRR